MDVYYLEVKNRNIDIIISNYNKFKLSVIV